MLHDCTNFHQTQSRESLVTTATVSTRSDSAADVGDVSGPPSDTPTGNDIVELLFFAYRDFVSDPDRLLTEYGFGRAHHRVLHFVERVPGMTIAEMLDILGITKQSLNPILKDLVEKGYIMQRTGTADRRQRLLYPTDKGRALSLALTAPQLQRIARALDGLEPDVKSKVTAFLFSMINDDDRDDVSRIVWKTADGEEQVQ